MGQRLNIEIWKGGKVLANAYYHWSAYTESALQLCKNIIQQYENIRVDPLQTCDSSAYEEQLTYRNTIGLRFGEGPIKTEKVALPGTHSRADRDRLLAIRLLEGTGAGVNEEELARIRREDMCHGITLRTSINRNAGLLAVTPEGIEDTRKWDEGRVVIHLDQKHVQFGVFYVDDFGEFLDEYEIDPDKEPERLPAEIGNDDIDIGDFAFSDIDKAIELVEKSREAGAISCGDTVYSWIM